MSYSGGAGDDAERDEAVDPGVVAVGDERRDERRAGGPPVGALTHLGRGDLIVREDTVQSHPWHRPTAQLAQGVQRRSHMT
jgi:hypothetical protein